LCPTPAAAGRRLISSAVAALLLVSWSGASGVAQGLSMEVRSRSLRPGEAVLVNISAPAGTTSITVDAFGSHWPAYRVADTSWRALIGIDLERHPGTYPLIAESAGSQALRATRDLTVVRGQFRERVLKVAPDYVNPPPDLLARIRREAEFMSAVYEHSAGEPTWEGGLRRPVAEVANSSFGTRSVFNGEPRSPHAGTDFLSPAGTPIQAPAGGRVVAARELFFTGNTIVIDHGLGVFSMLAHLSRIDVREGDAVNAGDIVGLVGATGRVPGPHLHWAMRVGTARVDPLSALALLAN